MTTTTEHPPTSARAAAPTPAGDRFVAVAAVTVGILLLAIQALAGEVIPPLAVFAALYLATGIAVGRRRSRWLLIVVIVLTLVHLVGSIPFFAANLAHPESPASFLSEAFVALALLVTLLGAIAGLRGARPGSRRPVAIAAGGLAALAVVISTVATSNVDSEARQADDIPVEAVRSTFPALIEVPAGGATLWIDNQDPFHHTFVIDGTDVHATLPGSTAVRTTVDLAPGTYHYLCDVPGHDEMEGELVVR